MSQVFGGESPRPHAQTPHRKPARFLVIIDSGGTTVARLFLESRELVAEFDAGTEETAQMTAGLVPTVGASGPEWDRALDGHSPAERSTADVYTLDVETFRPRRREGRVEAGRSSRPWPRRGEAGLEAVAHQRVGLGTPSCGSASKVATKLSLR